MHECVLRFASETQQKDGGGWMGGMEEGGGGGEGRKHFCLGCVLYLRVKLRLKEEPIINLQLSKKRKTNPH